MGLISGILMGTIVGIAMMAGWRHMMRYRSTKRIAKAVDIKLLGSLGRDDLKKICGDNYPEWISFPVYEQVKWLNKQLSKMWPFIADAATMVIRESVEPLLEEYRPPGITSLKFSKLSLGNVAPKIEGIRVQSLKEGQITMDIDFRWGGDPSIILAVEAALVASLPIQLKDLQVFTVARVIFQLAEEIPCISAVVVALLSEPKPRIDYTLKAVGGSLTAIPGLSDMIDDTVNSIISDMLQWPHRIVVPIGGIPVDTSDLELKPQGKLTVTVVKANELKNMEMIGKSDPYVVLYIRPLFKVKTKVIDNNLNPVWNETFELIAEDKETQALVLEVFDKDVTQDKRLGIVKLPLHGLEPDIPKELDLRLLPSLDMMKIIDKKDRGSLTVKVHLIQGLNLDGHAGLVPSVQQGRTVGSPGRRKEDPRRAEKTERSRANFKHNGCTRWSSFIGWIGGWTSGNWYRNRSWSGGKWTWCGSWACWEWYQCWSWVCGKRSRCRWQWLEQGRKVHGQELNRAIWLFQEEWKQHSSNTNRRKWWGKNSISLFHMAVDLVNCMLLSCYAIQ